MALGATKSTSRASKKALEATRAERSVGRRRAGALVGLGALGLRRPPDAGAVPAQAVESQEAVRRGGTVGFEVRLPGTEYHLTPGAASRCAAPAEAAAVALADDGPGRARAELVAEQDAGKIEGRCTVYFCRTDDVCVKRAVDFAVPVAPGGADRVSLAAALAPPQ